MAGSSTPTRSGKRPPQIFHGFLGRFVRPQPDIDRLAQLAPGCSGQEFDFADQFGFDPDGLPIGRRRLVGEGVAVGRGFGGDDFKIVFGRPRVTWPL